MDPIDTTNLFHVGVIGEEVVILTPPLRKITAAEALNLAAWLVVTACPEGTEFHRVLMAVRNA